jgi:hypothetical protein
MEANLRNEVRANFHTCYAVAIGSGGTISVYSSMDHIGPMDAIPGCMVVDFYKEKATMIYIDSDLNKYEEFKGYNKFSIRIVNRKDGIFIYLLHDDEYYYKPIQTSEITFENDIYRIWDIYINESYLMEYVEKRQI